MGGERMVWIRFRHASGGALGGYSSGDEVQLPDWMAYAQVSHCMAVIIDGPTKPGAGVANIIPQARICESAGCHVMAVMEQGETLCHYHKPLADKEPDAPPDKRKHRKRKRPADSGSGSPGVGRPRGGSDDDGG